MHLSEVFQHIRPGGEHQITVCRCCLALRQSLQQSGESGDIRRRRAEKGLHLRPGYSKSSYPAMLHDKSEESYNIGTGVSTKFNDIYAIVKEEMHSELEAEHVPNPLANYQYFTQADMAKTRRDLGFMPEYDLRLEIMRMLQNDTTLLGK